jgi:hypothetical protein
MAAVTASSIVDIVPALGCKMLRVKAPATADNADTIAVTLTNYGCTNIEGILGFTESTTGSVVITEAPTTSVSSGVLTITIGGSTADKARTFIVFAY